jgi:transposase
MNPSQPQPPDRFIGLDIHKAYFVAIGVNRAQEQIFGPQRVDNWQLGSWIGKHLTRQDALVLEMTTNTYPFYDALVPHVHSVLVVHPPHVALIVRAQVKTDRKAALALAQLHAAGLLTGVWIPPEEIRDLRTISAQRQKLVRLQTQAKNRLQNVLHRHHFTPPGTDLYHEKHKDWWKELPVTALEQVTIQSNLATLRFVQEQLVTVRQALAKAVADDLRLPLLVQLPGINLLGAVTLLAAIGDISRFPSSTQLVGYAGLGARVHDSGQLHQTGRITKAGRRDLRHVMVEAAQQAVRVHPHWKEVFARLELRLGRSKAIVAIARKLLVAVWHVLHEEEVDCHADATQVACAFFAYAYKVGVKNLPEGQSALQFTRSQLDRLGIGTELTEIPWGSKRFKLPPSTLLTHP